MAKRSALLSSITFALLLPFALAACTTPDPLVGCTACPATESLVLQSSTFLFTCSSTLDCTDIDAFGNCTQCIRSKTLNFNTSTSTYDCATYMLGCIYMQNGLCLQCSANNYYLDSTGTCQYTIISYCWSINVTTCTECADQNMVNVSNCSIGTTFCTTFDYTTWKCLTCPNGTSLHSSGVYCLTAIANCLVYQMSTCLQCQIGYILSNNTCGIDSTLNVFQQLLPSSYYLNSTGALLTVCLSTSQYYSNNSCTPITSGLPFCLTSSNSICTQCLPSFYLNTSSQCRSCSVYPNCLTCDSYNCKQCLPSYYLAVDLGLYSSSQFFNSVNVSQAVTSQCLPCSILGCLYCRNDFRSSNINSVRCDQCLFGYTLYNHTCYLCPDGFFLDIVSQNCSACMANCQFCPDTTTCTQCMPNFYYDTATAACANLTAFLASPVLTSANVFEVLNRSLPLSSTYIINNQKLLVTSCADTSNGFSCYCPSGTTNIYTSLCQVIPTSLTTVVLDPLALFGTNSTSLDKATFFTIHLRTLQLLSELPTFAFDYAPAANELISQDQLATYLQIKTNYIRNNPTLQSAQITLIASLVLTSMPNVLDPYTATVLAGPGYYFKYSPAAMETDDSSVVSTTHTAGTQTVVLLLYSSTQVTTNIIPTVYIFQNTSASSTVTLIIKKVNFLTSSQQYQIYFNGVLQTISPSIDNNGYLTILNVPTSTVTVASSITILAANSTAASELYSSQRIQNIIYRDSFIYILVVIFLYLFFLPMCAICDCVDNKAVRRRVQKQSDTYQGIQHNKTEQTEPDQSDESHRGEENILNINYKDFFPIYNIANTERPRRLVKLCLFIVNLQHSVTFLILVYFHLAASQPLLAVVLAIPAYLCTLIMGYICGAITVKLPGKTKYLINIITPLYWILWVALMNIFTSSEYKPYVYTFIIIFFVIDMILDLLETLLMYFTIKQEDRQAKLFQVLAKWLSYRGYYQFNQMARKLEEARENEEQ